MSRPAQYPTGILWDRFYEITQVPRPSKHEDKIREYLINFAQLRNLEYVTDQVGNVVIYLPATPGHEKHESIIIQNHMDMVTDATPDREINFLSDPIKLQVQDGWICADRTTLGADNGIGCAAALALADDQESVHPCLELLFTVDEETGLHGAINLDSSKLSGKKLINLDTEEWGAIYLGCAGGADYEFFSSLKYRPVSLEQGWRISLKGLTGGHSGIDIHRSRGNALVLLIQLLNEFSFPWELASFSGGKAHNIIPRDAQLDICCSVSDGERLKDVLSSFSKRIKRFLPEEDHHFTLDCFKIDRPEQVVACEDLERVKLFLTLFPHGAYSYNWDVEPPCANISSNFAIFKLDQERLYLQTSCRFFEEEELVRVRQQIETLAAFLGGELKMGCGYPSWKPVKNNKLLELAQELFQEQFGFRPETKAIHAGLECGLLKDKLGDIDIISFGPNITGAHSPSERLEISSTEKFYHFLKVILQNV